jgi:hypothetical protein
MPAGDDDLGPGQANWLASVVADGTAKPEEARQLIEAFVRQVDAGKLDPTLVAHVRDCFAAFLAGKKTLHPAASAGRASSVNVRIQTLEKAFGLTRVTRGQPPLDDDVLIEAAAELLEERLAGRSHQDALANVEESRRAAALPAAAQSQIGEAWAAHKRDALVWLRLGRSLRGEAWTNDEIEQLREIYADVPGVTLPGEKP